MKTPGRKRWVKILLNPVLTKFGWIIVSEFSDNGRFVGFKFTTYPEHCRGDFSVWLKVRL